MFPWLLLATFGACLGVLGIYALAMLATALLAWRNGAALEPRASSKDAKEAVTVLVPSHHEGEAVVDTIRTLVGQDHPGAMAIWILIDDATDASVEALARAWPTPWERSKDDPRRRLVFGDGAREIVLVECGVGSKTDKLNAVLGDLTTPRVAILDADHRADPTWISSALACMARTGARAAQSRRRPLATLGLAQIWDSLQNHLGNEALNRALSGGGHTVFFTGTTAVFDAALFGTRRFGRSITEDTYLSLELIADREWIAYEGGSGSYEEVAPSIATFIARRRRWAAGHTHAFFTHLRRLLPRPKHASRVVLAFHGVFYLIPTVVLVSLWVLAVHDLVQFPRSVLAVWGLASALLAGVLFALVGRHGRRATDFVVALLWAAPQAAFATVYLYRWSGAEGYYYLLSFPREDAFRIPIAVTLLTPLAALLIAARPVGGTGAARLLIGTITYPLMLFIDLYAALLGVADLVVGRPAWTKIARENVIATDAVPEALRQTMTTASVRRSRFARLLWLPAAALFVVLMNDLLSPSECGQVHPFLWKPLLVHRTHPVDLSLTVKKTRLDDDRLTAAFDVALGRSGGGALALTWFLDGARIADGSITNEATRSATLPLGWEQHEAAIELRGDEFICRRTRRFSTNVTEIKGSDFFVNGERFWVKGMIPSFATNQINLDFPTGLHQIKAIGANAIRIYHEPSAEVLAAAAKEQLLILDQPERSTWENVDLDSERDRERLVMRYRTLVDDTDGYPYLLMDNLGNELELTGKLPGAIDDVRKLIDAARGSDGTSRRFPLSYSTYYTFVDYPVDVVGVNMLDTGAAYWKKALAVVAHFGKPFFATELGGFVAFHERVPWELRAERIREEWQHLQSAGAFGAFFFESHDNWAQSVPPGEVNDPLAADQPDDTRGFWDEKNQPKPELAAVERAFRDFTARAAPEVLPPDRTVVTTQLTNVRPYALRNVRATLEDGSVRELADFRAHEERAVSFPIAPRGEVHLTIAYTTHHGLSGTTRLTVRPLRVAPAPIVTNDDFAETERTATTLRGRLADSRSLHLWLPPNWPAVVVNGERFERPASGALDVPMRGPFYEVENYETTHDGPGGQWQLHFRLPKVDDGLLVLRGIGAAHAQVTVNGRTTELATHNYRDNVVTLAELHAAPGDDVTVAMNRDQIEYLDARFSPDHRAIHIDVDAPQVFAPMRVAIDATH